MVMLKISLDHLDRITITMSPVFDVLGKGAAVQVVHKMLDIIGWEMENSWIVTGWWDCPLMATTLMMRKEQ